jgi:histidinol-phosphate aminotransferase
LGVGAHHTLMLTKLSGHFPRRHETEPRSTPAPSPPAAPPGAARSGRPEGPASSGRARAPSLALNRNEYFFAHPAPVLEALAGAPAGASQYATVALHEALIRELASGLGVRPEQVTLFHGAEDALVKLLSWHRQAARQIVVSDFSWLTYRDIAGGLGYEVRQTPCERSPRGFSTPLGPLAELLAAADAPTVVLLASPNNPTGHGLPFEEFLRLVARFPRHVFVLDGVYDAFASAFVGPAALFPNCYFVGSFSKLFGLPGLRVGYAVGPCPPGLKLALGLPAASLRAALAALGHRAAYERNRAVMSAFARELGRRRFAGVAALESDAPFVLVRVDRPELGADDFARAEAASGATPKYLEHGGARYLRWSLGPPSINARVESYLASLQSPSPG